MGAAPADELVNRAMAVRLLAQGRRAERSHSWCARRTDPTRWFIPSWHWPTTRLDPLSVDAGVLRARVGLMRGNVSEACAALESLAARLPRSATVLAAHGIVLEAAGREREARDRYEQALAIDPRAWVAASNLSVIYADSGRPLDGVRLAESAASQVPDEAAAHDALGWSLLRAGRPSSALAAMQRAVALAPSQATYRSHLDMIRAEVARR